MKTSGGWRKMILEVFSETPGCFSVNLLDHQPLTPGPFTAKMLKKITTLFIASCTALSLVHIQFPEIEFDFGGKLVYAPTKLSDESLLSIVFIVGMSINSW